MKALFPYPASLVPEVSKFFESWY